MKREMETELSNSFASISVGIIKEFSLYVIHNFGNFYYIFPYSSFSPGAAKSKNLVPFTVTTIYLCAITVYLYLSLA